MTTGLAGLGLAVSASGCLGTSGSAPAAAPVIHHVSGPIAAPTLGPPSVSPTPPADAPLTAVTPVGSTIFGPYSQCGAKSSSDVSQQANAYLAALNGATPQSFLIGWDLLVIATAPTPSDFLTRYDKDLHDVMGVANSEAASIRTIHFDQGPASKDAATLASALDSLNANANGLASGVDLPGVFAFLGNRFNQADAQLRSDLGLPPANCGGGSNNNNL
jgi:hypothetical protein